VADLLTDVPSAGFTVAVARTSVSAYLIKMAVLRMKILQYIHSDPESRTRHNTPAPWMAESQFYHFKQKLEEFKTSLPSDVQFLDGTKPRHEGIMIPFFTLHAMFHAAYTDLLRAGTHRSPVWGNVMSAAPDSFVSECRRGRLEHAFDIAKVVSSGMREPPLVTEHDPFVAICSCLALRILVVEGQNAPGNPFLISNPDVQECLHFCKECAVKTAQWSKPVRKLLLAVDELVSSHGYPLELPDFAHSGSGHPTRPSSRPSSPSLNIYGTSGAIEKNRADDDLEAAQIPVSTIMHPVQASTSSMAQAPTSLSSSRMWLLNLPETNDSTLGDIYLQSEQLLSPETLRIASNWDDGTYDVESAQAQFDQWADVDLSWGQNFEGMDARFENIWGSSGVPPSLPFSNGMN
jgi:hypothetical protein